MPLAKVHVLEGQYDDARLGKMSEAIQNALIEVLGVPPDDFFQIHHVLPRDRYRHTPAFLGQEYSDDMILLELTFITGRSKETRLALLKSLNEKIVAAARYRRQIWWSCSTRSPARTPRSAAALRSEPTSRLRADHTRSLLRATWVGRDPYDVAQNRRWSCLSCLALE
jgi:Tautomerase enzyme